MPPSKAERPSLAKASLTLGSSYLDDHLEYKSQQPTGPSTSIDGIIESSPQHPGSSLSPPLSLSPSRPPTLAHHEGLTHTLLHTNCVPGNTDAPRLVATIYYNSSSFKDPRQHQHQHQPDQSSAASPAKPVAPQIAQGAAPTTLVADYPLELPPPEPEPLDRLYGPYVSQLCLTHFLSTLDSLLIHNAPDRRRLTSSHRCLAPSSDKPRIVEVTFSPPPNPDYLPTALLSKHEAIYRFEREWNCEVILQPSTVFRQHKRLAVFDMDSTLIQQEVIDEIAAFVGVEKQVSAITARAMNGELDFAASLRARVALLKGVPADVFERLKTRIVITPGAKELCRCLKRLGLTLAVLSGGFQPLAEWLAGQLGLDHAFANHLLVDPATNTLTGELDPAHAIVDGERKRSLLQSLAAERGISLQQTMAVGDGANDIPMLTTAGLGVAWRAKSKVQMEAPARLNVGESLLDLVYLLGLTASDVEQLLHS